MQKRPAMTAIPTGRGAAGALVVVVTLAPDMTGSNGRTGTHTILEYSIKPMAGNGALRRLQVAQGVRCISQGLARRRGCRRSLPSESLTAKPSEVESASSSHLERPLYALSNLIICSNPSRVVLSETGLHIEAKMSVHCDRGGLLVSIPMACLTIGRLTG